MKFYLAFVVAVIGVGMVAADENLKSKLQMALKSMLNENEELQMQSRDSKGRCESDTNSCNNQGTCTQGRWGSYYCKCQLPYMVGGADSSCYPPKGETKDLEIEARGDSVNRCLSDTGNCDGHGICQLSTFGRYEQYVCLCALGYRNNNYGGCSPYTPREIEFLSYVARDLELEMLTRDSVGRCNSDTNECDGFGECKAKTNGRYRGEYICECNVGYSNNHHGGCSPIVTPATEVDDDDFTERKKEILRQLAEFLQEE